ncbi:MAG TPA: acetyl-coenzyme A synthetase N-terminal domain-containing protein, partial [Thermoplasmata archaeon]|nr:acetyl-coenzyme A synthetase N-terminal domain-containing protein [Thermoplasmata archaeon]
MAAPGPARPPAEPSWGPAERAAIDRYRAEHRRSLDEGLDFFARMGREELRWHRPFSRTLDWDPPFARWYPDGTLNAAENCLGRHRGGPAWDRIAYHWEGEDGATRSVSYAELDREVGALARGLADDGFGPADD